MDPKKDEVEVSLFDDGKLNPEPIIEDAITDAPLTFEMPDKFEGKTVERGFGCKSQATFMFAEDGCPSHVLPAIILGSSTCVTLFVS